MQDFTQHSQVRSTDQAAVSAEAAFFQRIYTWMCAGLLVTSGVAYVAAGSEALLIFIYGSVIVQLGAIAVLLGLVWYLRANIESLSPATAKILFMVYAALMGVLLCGVVVFYSGAAIFTSFVASAGVYGAMAIYGLVTKRSLEGWGSFLFMGVGGIILVSLVNMIIGSSLVHMAIGVIGVFIFAGLTAYEHQALRVIYATGLDGTEDGESRVVIIGALTLYLSFVNLFLMFLHIFGGSRD